MNKTLNDNMGASWTETPKIETLLFSFVDSEFKRNVKAKDDGANDNTEKLLHCAAALISNHSIESFSANDFYLYCEPFEIPFEAKRDFFQRFTAMLIKNNRCVETKGCYSESVFCLV